MVPNDDMDASVVIVCDGDVPAKLHLNVPVEFQEVNVPVSPLSVLPPFAAAPPLPPPGGVHNW